MKRVRKCQYGVLATGLMAGSAWQAAMADPPPFVSLDDTNVRMTPGEQRVLRLWVRRSAYVEVFSAYAPAGEYTISVPTEPGCAVLDPAAGIYRVLFDTSAGGGELECRYTIRREAHSINDLSMALDPLGNNGMPVSGGVRLRFGAVPYLALSVSYEGEALLPDGRLQRMARLRVDSDGTLPLNGASAGFCFDNAFPGFVMDASVAGGCARGTGGYCFFSGFAFGLPTVPPGGSSSCLVQLTSREPYEQPLYFPLRLIDTLPLRDALTGGSVLRVPGSRDHATLVVARDRVFDDGFEPAAAATSTR